MDDWWNQLEIRAEKIITVHNIQIFKGDCGNEYTREASKVWEKQ